MISPVGNGRGSPLCVAIATGIDNVLGIETGSENSKEY